MEKKVGVIKVMSFCCLSLQESRLLWLLQSFEVTWCVSRGLWMVSAPTNSEYTRLKFHTQLLVMPHNYINRQLVEKTPAVYQQIAFR